MSKSATSTQALHAIEVHSHALQEQTPCVLPAPELHSYAAQPAHAPSRQSLSQTAWTLSIGDLQLDEPLDDLTAQMHGQHGSSGALHAVIRGHGSLPCRLQMSEKVCGSNCGRAAVERAGSGRLSEHPVLILAQPSSSVVAWVTGQQRLG